MVEVTVVVVMTTVEPVWNTTGIRTAATRCSSASCGRADAQAEANRQAKAISTDVCCILVQAELQSLSIKSTTKLQLSCCTCKPVVCTSSQKVHQVIKVQQKKSVCWLSHQLAPFYRTGLTGRTTWTASNGPVRFWQSSLLLDVQTRACYGYNYVVKLDTLPYCR